MIKVASQITGSNMEFLKMMPEQLVNHLEKKIRNFDLFLTPHTKIRFKWNSNIIPNIKPYRY